MRRLNASKAPSSETGEDKMDHIKLQSRFPARSSNIFHRNSRPQPKFKLCIISSLSIALVFVLCYLLLFSRKPSSSLTRRYSIIIDGGSTGTRIHVFMYDLVEKNPSFDFGERGLASMRVNPGLSAYAEDPIGAGGSIRELIDFGKQRVPREYHSETEIRLMATAGMRLLKLQVQYQILESCRLVLRGSGFKFRDEWASVITGSDEGMYAWVVANYALDTLGSDPQLTTGIIELGGASAQVTFSSGEPLPSEFSRIVKYRNTTYNLYSHSFLHFGQNVAFETLRESLVSGDNNTASKYLQQGVLADPCTPKGYSYLEHQKTSLVSIDNSRYVSSIRSQGNFSECRSVALKMLQKGKDQCAHHHCYIGSTFTPKLQGKFMATENFFYTSMFFGLAERAPISGFIASGKQFCEEEWSVLKKRHSSMHEEDLLHYCFSSAYIVAILHDSLGIPLNDESRIVFANQVGSIPLDWALGAFILQSTTTTMDEYEKITRSAWIATISGEESPIVLLVAFILITCILIAWYILRSGKTQFKTIYDLEKGRYIVTRVNR